jgi:hypothetical protein
VELKFELKFERNEERLCEERDRDLFGLVF